MSNENPENPENVAVSPAESPRKVRSRGGWRKTFAVPLADAERHLLDRASQAQGMPVATYVRRCALMAAQEQLKAMGESVDMSTLGKKY